MKKIMLVAAALVTFSGCSTISDFAYDQREVDASGPTPDWVSSPDKVRRLSLEKGIHIFIARASGKKLEVLKRKACSEAKNEALESGFSATDIKKAKWYWSRTRGSFGDRFHLQCLVETQSAIVGD